MGAEVRLTVGGKVDRLHGDPVEVAGRVRVLHDGTYVEREVRHGGRRLNHMGPTALVEVPGRNLPEPAGGSPLPARRRIMGERTGRSTPDTAPMDTVTQKGGKAWRVPMW